MANRTKNTRVHPIGCNCGLQACAIGRKRVRARKRPATPNLNLSFLGLLMHGVAPRPTSTGAVPADNRSPAGELQ